jgi:nucleoside-diphosphate-sugar epimerase
VTASVEISSNICVLGGTGFIGKHLLNFLKTENVSRIIVLSRQKDKVWDYPENVEIVVGDLLDVDSLIYFLRSRAIVINLAFLKNESEEVNVKAAENLGRACVEVGVRRLIHCSTAVVVGKNNDDVITEETACSPVTEYEQTKFEIENILLKNLAHMCEVVIVRPTAVFGAGGKNLLKHAEDLINEFRLTRMIKASLYAKRRLNLVDVRNVVEAILFLGRYEGDVCGQSFLVSDDDSEMNNYYDVTRLLCQHLGLREPYIIHFPFQPLILRLLLSVSGRSNTNPKRIYSSEKLMRLGFKRPVPPQEGIKKFALWYRDKMMRNRN